MEPRHAPANARFLHLRAEELSPALGRFRVVTFAQSFHWMEQRRVAALAFELLDDGGAVVHIAATTHEGEGNVPREAIAELVRAYLGPERRAGRGVVRTPRSEEDEAFRAAGFEEPLRLEVGAGRLHERSEDDVVASVFSLSSAAPHLFGDRLGDFEADLRRLLREAAPDGRFTERARPVALAIWRQR